MLFTIQTYLEEYLNKRNIIDADGYAVRLANLYFYHRLTTDDALFFKKLEHIKTVLFQNNGIDNRKDFEKSVIRSLDSNFKKKLSSNNLSFPGGIELERTNLQRLPKLTIDVLLNEFKHAVEARAIDAFWISRVKNTLRRKPEKIAQDLFALFTHGVLMNRSGIVLREFLSGIGFVDVGVIFSSATLHLVEIKILTDNFIGLDQLEQYMKTEMRKEGSLLVIDSLKPDKKINLPTSINTPTGIIKVYQVDINPHSPSSLN